MYKWNRDDIISRVVPRRTEKKGTMITIQNELKDLLFNILKDKYKIEREDIGFTIPSARKFGDISTTIPFVIAKRIGKKPFLIGKELVNELKGKHPLISDIRIEGGGFLNFFLNKKNFLNHLIKKQKQTVKPKDKKIIVEHTSINPNKSAHIGHIRNSSLGDTLAGTLKFLGYNVEIQNYLDDTGIQVADVVWGLLDHDGETVQSVKGIQNLPVFLWKRYPYYSSLLSENRANKSARDSVHKNIENKKEPFYSVSSYISETVVKDHIRLMDKINIRYNVLVKESDIIELKLFEEAAKLLKNKKIMYLSKDPEKENCWVIDYKKGNIEKIIIRSNGTSTYIGKDIAYALWKVGLLGKDFYFKDFFTYDDGQPVSISGTEPNNIDSSFGNGDKIFTVIDVRQSYLQKIISDEVINPLNKYGREKEYIHFSYEMVALTPGCVEEMGFQLSEEEKKKSYIEVSGRKGVAVSGEELLEKLIEKSKMEISERNPDIDLITLNKIAKDISVGALRYYMIKFNSNSVISFDFEDALSFEGDTGPYLQYTMVRINSIFNKLNDNDLSEFELNINLFSDEEKELYFDIMLHISLMEIQLEHAIDKREISSIASHTYQLCQKMNHYYHKYPVISEKDKTLKNLRIILLGVFRKNLGELFKIMGIPVPERM